MTIQIIPGPADVFLAGLDVVCERLQVTPLEEQVRASIKKHHHHREHKHRSRAKLHDLIHPDFDKRRDLLPQELQPFGVRVLQKNQTVAKDIDVSWFAEK